MTKKILFLCILFSLLYCACGEPSSASGRGDNCTDDSSSACDTDASFSDDDNDSASE